MGVINFFSDPIVALVVGIITGAVSCFTTVWIARKYRSQGQLSLVVYDDISLLHEVAQKLTNLLITVSGRPVADNVHLVRFAIINDGNLDVDESMIDKAVTCIVPEGFEFLDASIESENVETDHRIDKNEIEIKVKNIKINEKIDVTSLISVPEEKDKIPFGLKGRILNVNLGNVRLHAYGDEVYKEAIGTSAFLIALSLFMTFLCAIAIATYSNMDDHFFLLYPDKFVAHQITIVGLFVVGIIVLTITSAITLNLEKIRRILNMKKQFSKYIQ